MSLLCLHGNCNKIVDFECQCPAKNRLCKIHYSFHMTEDDCTTAVNVKAKMTEDLKEATSLLDDVEEKEKEILGMGNQILAAINDGIQAMLEELRNREARVLAWNKGSKEELEEIAREVAMINPERRLEEFKKALDAALATN